MEAFALLESVFRHAPVGLAFWDRRLRWRRLNERLADINGIPLEDHIGRTAPELLGALGEEVHGRLEQVLRTREPLHDLQMAGEIPATPGRVRHWLVSYYPVLDPDGAPLGVGAVVVETTRLEESRERERASRAQAEALLKTAAALSQSVDPDAVLKALADAAVPDLADWCAIHVARNGRPVLAAVAHAEPEREALAWELNRRFPPAADDRGGTAAVLRTGAPVVMEELTDEVLAATARGPEHLRIMRDLGLRSGALLPLSARGTTLGALTLMFAESGRVYTPDRLATAQALAAQAAVALDNATLYSEQAGLAQTLQRSLLPAELPDVPGVEMAARYRPAGRVNAVGGDFYAVWPDERGAWRLVVGDVTGKGAEAAALTALVRHTLHAGTVRGDGAEAELTLANDVLMAQHATGAYCTAVYGRLEPGPGGARLELVSAGHPPPLVLRAGGRVEEVAVHGSLLGLQRGMRFQPVALELGPGDVLLLYTDGAIELRGLTVPDGEAALRTVLRQARDRSVVEIVEAVEHHALVQSGGDPRDDLALLALRYRG